jgi:hypothetical protein
LWDFHVVDKRVESPVFLICTRRPERKAWAEAASRQVQPVDDVTDATTFAAHFPNVIAFAPNVLTIVGVPMARVSAVLSPAGAATGPGFVWPAGPPAISTDTTKTMRFRLAATIKYRKHNEHQISCDGRGSTAADMIVPI